MYEKNWTARIVFGAIGVIVLAILVFGYIRGGRQVAQEHHVEVISNDRFPG